MAESRHVPVQTSLGPSDRIMWRIEQDPVLRSPIVVVALLDSQPELASVRSTLERAVARVPRLRQRVRPVGARKQLTWVDDDAFDLDYHLRRVRAPGHGALRDVLDLAEPWATAALDDARPLWEFTLVDGVEGGRAAFVLKFHHTITDGVGGIDIAAKIFDADRHRRPVAIPDNPAPAPDRQDTSRGLLATVVRQAAVTMRDPVTTVRGGARFARSLARLFAPVPEPLSPLLLGRGLGRRLDVLELPLNDLRDAAHAAGVTVNDLFLAGIGGGLHDFHHRAGRNVPALRITMPISLRRDEDPEGGNRFAPARFVLPIDDRDPLRRARIAHAIAQGWRKEPALGTTELLASILDRLPGAVLTSIFGAMLKNVDVNAVDVPGLSDDAFIGGARIDRMWAFAPPTGAAISITLLSHGDSACIGVLADRAAVDDFGMLVDCIAAGLREVAGLGVRHDTYKEVS